MRCRLVSGLLAIVVCIPIAVANAEQIAFTVSYSEEELTITRDREGFDHFVIEGTRPDLRTPGAPALPMRVATVVLPADQTVSTARVTVDHRQVLDGTYRPSPAPDDDGTRTPRDEYYEGRDAAYPDQTAESVEEIMVLGGVRILRLFISPLLWHPQAESIELLESISVQITTEPMRTAPPARRPDAGFVVGSNMRDWMRSHAVNGADVDQWYPLHQPRYPDERESKSSAYQQQPFGDEPTQWPSRQSIPVEMIIVASEIASDGSGTSGILTAMGEYADWRDVISQTEVRSLQDITEHYPGVDAAHSIKLFFADAWQNWGADWFLLAGDVENVPTRLLGGDSSSNPLALRRDAPNEQYFVWVDEDWNLDGDQWYGESGDTMFVGATQLGSIARLPCRTAEEAEIIVDKLKSYQSPPGSIPSSYYESMLGAAGPTNEYVPPGPTDPPDESSGYEVVESAISKLGAGWNPTRLYGKIPTEPRHCSTSQTQEECYGPLRTYINSLGADTWDGNDLFDYLDSGFHLVLHVEHSFWDRLGEPSMSQSYPNDGQCDLSATFKAACSSWLDSLWKNTVEPLTSDEVARLTNDPLYSVICSSGSFTNAFDNNSISEELMRSADGGAVAYIGKPASFGGTFGDIFGNLLSAAANDGLSLGEAHTYAILQDVQKLPVTALKLPILGDPAMIVWGKDGPQDLQITGFPSTIAPGSASVEVTVKDGSSVAVPAARTVLVQGGSVYATTVSDENGVARFKHAAIASSEDVRVYAHKPGYRVAADTASVQGSGVLVYDAHEVFDGVHGDGDGVLDAGEKASVRVRFRNLGTAAVTPTDLRVLPAPRATVGLLINDQYRPGSVYLGAGSAHPASVADSFAIPVSWQGARIEGEPTSFINEERFLLWRRDSDGQYALASHSPSASADTVFTGWIRVSGGVTLGSTLLDGSDQVGVNGDLIEFQFLGDGTADQITFQAEAEDWLELTPPSPTFYSPVAAGDTVSVLVTIEATSEIPGQELPMTASAKSGTTWWYSDFGLTVERPDVELWGLQILPGEEAGYDTAIVIVPTIANLGAGQADSISFELDVLTSGCAILDGVASCGTFAGGTRRTLSDSLIIGAPTIAALDTLTFDVTATLWYLGRPLPLDIAIGSGEGGGYTPIPPVTTLITHSFGNELELTWDPVTWTYDSVVYEPEYYLVFLARDTGGIKYPPVARVDADLVTRARISADENGVPLPDAAGATDSIRVAVVAVGQGHIMGPVWVSGVPELTNLADVPTNWPKLVPGGATVPPKIVEIDGREAVLVAGKAIYGWWTDDGTPIVSANADGLIFQPTDAEPNDKDVFTEALAYGDYEDNGWHRMIYGNRAQDGLYAVEITPVANSYTASLSWFSDIRSDLNAPVLFRWNIWYLDDPLVAILGRDGADYKSARSADTLYVWEMDGTPWLNDPVPTGVRPGAFGSVPSFNGRVSSDGWRSLAVHVDQDLYGSSTLIQTTRYGGLVAWDEQSRSSGTLADPRWSRTVQGVGGYTLSPPAVGCVNSSSSPLIVFTNSQAANSPPIDPTVYIYSIGGNEVAALSDPDWIFYNSEDNEPPPRPVLVCEGGDAATIVIGGGGGPGASSTYAYAFRYEEQPDDWNVTEMVDTFPRPSRGVWGNAEGWAEPVVAQVNGEGGLDVLLPTRTKSVVSWDLELGQPRPGWPLILGDAPLTPAISGERLYVAAGGTLHAWDLKNESAGAAWTQWTQYGRGAMAVGNAIGDNMAFLPVSACQYGPRPAPSDAVELRASIRPGGRDVLIEYTVSAGRRYVLEAFDVAGRRIARLAEGTGGDHETKQAMWKPRGPSGVYFLRLDNGAGTTTRRVVLVR